MWRENTTQLPITNFQPPIHSQIQTPNYQALSNDRAVWKLGVGRVLGVGSWSLGVVLQFPELGEFEEDRIRVHQRDRQAHGAVENASAQQVVPQERRRRMHD